MNTNFAKEFKLYESMFSNKNKKTNEKTLIESRSVADIEAEIERLKQELEQAKVAEKNASYAGKLPLTVWVWDMYIDKADKGSWLSIESDMVFETKEKALNAGWQLLNELDDQNDLDEEDEGIEPDDYTVEAFEIPLLRVSDDVLKWSGLGHLITGATKYVKTCPRCSNTIQVTEPENNGDVAFTCPFCGQRLKARKI